MTLHEWSRRSPGVTVPRKIRCPPPFGLARKRLEDALAGCDGPSQALVVAPPGAGKTTLLSRVAAAAGPATAWYSADAQDADETDLVRYLAQALLGDRAEALAPGAGIESLLAALGDGSTTGPQLLVVDDLHEVAGTPAEEALARFLTLRPRTVRVLLGSRRPPTFNTPRMLASGDLVELSGDDLRFRSWEVEDLFREVHRQPLAPEAAALLCRRVGGLAAALQLFHLSVRGLSRAEREAEVVHLNGRSRLIRSYLACTVLDGLTPELRDFLLRTSPLGVLDGKLCDTLLGRSSSAAVLRDLEREQLFTTTPDEGVSYRYHQVLRDHLEVVLEDELPPWEVTALHARAARLLEMAGHDGEALRAYKRAGDWGAAARLVRRNTGVTDPDVGTPATGGLVVAEQNDPWLAVARIRRLLRQGSIETALDGLRHVEASADDPDLAGHCVRERLQASVWRGASPPPSTPARSPLVALRSLTCTGQPRHTAGPEPEWGLVAAIAEMLSGRLDRGRLELDRVFPRLVEGSWSRLAAGLLSTLLELGDPGRLQHCCASLEDLSLSADVQGFPWLARVAQGVQACLVLESAGEPWRAGACRSAIEACRRDGDRWGELVVRAVIAAALARGGLEDEARSHLEVAARASLELGAPVLGLWVRALTLAVRPAAPGAGPPADDKVLLGLAHQVGMEDVDALLTVCRTATHRHAAQSATSGHAARGDRRVDCLGGFRLYHDGELDLLPLRPRARQLLMLLALHHGAEVHREHLIDNLWPDAALDAGTHRLQVAMSSIRRLLEGQGVGPTAVQRRGDSYRLQLPGATVDIQLLERGIAELDEALHRSDPEALADRAAGLIRLYRGDLLPEAGAAEWVVLERERLRVGTARALAGVARTCLELGRADLGLWPARRGVELDPWQDAAWLVLARIQRDLGDHCAAQVTLTEHERVSAELSPPAQRRPAARPPPDAARARV